MPDDVAFHTKPEIALDHIRAALAAGIPRGTVLMDAGYGADTKLRTAITELARLIRRDGAGAVTSVA